MNKEIKNIKTYVDNLEICGDISKEIITVEHRCNNPKRDFLFVNRMQGKHIPCDPDLTISMCEKLARKVRQGLLENDRVLVIGFAETATAIGELVAMYIPQTVYVMHTTREKVGKSLIEFREEHSHATEQTLAIREYTDPNEFLSRFNYILFVEDEISTGNTIKNSIKAFRDQKFSIEDLTFGVASICNWQTYGQRAEFEALGIDRYYLISGELKDEKMKMNIESKSEPLVVEINDLKYFGYENERLGRDYNSELAEDDINKIVTELGKVYIDSLMSSDKGNTTVRIIGTEESMVVPIMVGSELKRIYNLNVKCHSSSRSKIDVLNSDFDDRWTGIKDRHKIPSMYDINRETYIYNLNDYSDIVILISDGRYTEEMLKQLPEFKTNQLIVVRV
jgi:hypothetical protein